MSPFSCQLFVSQFCCFFGHEELHLGVWDRNCPAATSPTPAAHSPDEHPSITCTTRWNLFRDTSQRNDPSSELCTKFSTMRLQDRESWEMVDANARSWGSEMAVEPRCSFESRLGRRPHCYSRSPTCAAMSHERKGHLRRRILRLTLILRKALTRCRPRRDKTRDSN